MSEELQESGIINNGNGITFEYILNVIETSCFTVIYAVQNSIIKKHLFRREYIRNFAKNLLDFAHIVPFLIHFLGFQYGEVTISWGRFCRWVQLQLPIYTYSPFPVAFWFTILAQAFVLGLIVFIALSSWKKYQGKELAISIAHSALTTGVQVFFPAAFYIMAIPLFCDWRDQRNFVIESKPECFSNSYMINVIIGAFGSACLIGIAFISSLVHSFVEPIENDLTLTTGVAFKMQYYLTICFMTINRFWISPAISPQSFGNWWEALFNILALSGLFANVVYALPFQLKEANSHKAAVISSLWWISCVSFISVNIGSNPLQNNRQIDYILIAGLIPFLLLGEYIVRLRYYHLEAMSHSLIEEMNIAKLDKENEINASHMAAENLKSTKIEKKGTKTVSNDNKIVSKVDKIQDAQREALLAIQKTSEFDKSHNVRSNLPQTLIDYNCGITTIDLIGRILWHHTEDALGKEAAASLYDKAEKAFPEICYLKVLRISYYTSNAIDASAHLPKLDILRNSNPNLLCRYYLFKRSSDIRDLSKISKNSSGENGLDLVAYIEFQNLFAETKIFNDRAITSIRDFWSLFLQKSITTIAFNRGAKELKYHAQRSLNIYKTMLLKFPRNHQVLTTYAFFLDLVLRNGDEAQRYLRKADEQKAREADDVRNGNTSGLIDLQAVVAITEDASIDQVNKVLLKLFGYRRNEVLGRNIKLLVPSPWKEKHDGILSRYRRTGIAKVIGVPQTLYGQHKDGYVFSMRLLVQERRKDNGERNFIGMIQATSQDSLLGTIIISEMGIIKTVSLKTLELFGGYTAYELLGKNILILMPDNFAANHDGYLKRYRDTGEARVIGTSGRNVPGKRKNGTLFPANLTVAELYADGERFFVATIQDTSNTSGNIYMDGFGIIQNSDLGIQQLLGYKKESIVGKNIKGIMPSPYSDYHDMFLERYRRTRVSNVLRSVEGRILPAIHADGSVVQLRAIIQRSDNGDAGSTMMFKALIRRGDLDSLAGPNGRKGYLEFYELEMNTSGVITSINQKILNMLGHSSNEESNEFIGQPIEILVPPIPDKPSQQKSHWMLNALKNPDLNFYALMATKTLNLLPVTFCLTTNSDGSIRMRIRDVSELDALLSIDEVGNILSINDDGYMLMGHKPDEILGRNIKYIQPPDVAAQHDGYLLRYKETKVARVVGIARSVDAIHRDRSIFPIEIQVTEKPNLDGAEGSKKILGRLRHRKLEERVEKELIQKFFIKKQIAIAESGSIGGSAVSVHSNRKINFKGRFNNSSNSKRTNGESFNNSFQQDGTEDENELSQSLNASSRMDGSVTSSNKFLTVLAKLKDINSSSSPNPSIIELKKLLNWIFLGYVCFFAIGLIVTNAIPTTISSFDLIGYCLKTDFAIHKGIFSSRLFQLSMNSSVTWSYCKWTDGVPGNVAYYPTGDNSSKILCPWINSSYLSREPYLNSSQINSNYDTQYQLPKMLDYATSDVISDSLNLKSTYSKNRRVGDKLDLYIQGSTKLFIFPNSTVFSINEITANTLWNLLTLFSNSMSVVALNRNFDNRSYRSWLSVMANRKIYSTNLSQIIDIIFEMVNKILENNQIFHLILAIISIVMAIVFFPVFILPLLRKVQSDREKILRLLALMPKSSIYDLVHRVYRAPEKMEEDEDEESDEKKSSEEDESDEYDHLTSDQELNVIGDRSILIFAIFWGCLSILAIPVVAHAIYAFISTSMDTNEVELAKNIGELYMSNLELSYVQFNGFMICPDPSFCEMPYSAGINKIATSLARFESAYKSVLLNIEINPDINNIFSIPQCFNSGNSLQRCVTSDSVYFPKNFFAKTSQGYSALAENIIRSSKRWIIECNSSISSTTGLPIFAANSTSDDFWFLYEVGLIESEAALYQAFKISIDNLNGRASSGILAASISYAIGLLLSFIIFYWVFGGIRNDITQEAKYQRGVLFMVPHAVLRNTREMIEYIDKLHAEIVEET